MHTSSRIPHLVGSVACIAVTAIACVLPVSAPRVHFIPTAAPRPPRPHAAPLMIYLTSRPAEPYEELGLIEIREDLKASLGHVSKAARWHGANALMLVSTDLRVTSSTSYRTVEAKDRKGKVLHTQEVPVSETDTHEVNRFVALWVQDLEPLPTAPGSIPNGDAGFDAGTDVRP